MRVIRVRVIRVRVRVSFGASDKLDSCSSSESPEIREGDFRMICLQIPIFSLSVFRVSGCRVRGSGWRLDGEKHVTNHGKTCVGSVCRLGFEPHGGAIAATCDGDFRVTEGGEVV